jgi:hypothetical protein
MVSKRTPCPDDVGNDRVFILKQSSSGALADHGSATRIRQAEGHLLVTWPAAEDVRKLEIYR